MNIDSLKPLFLPSNVGAMASGLESVTQGVTKAMEKGALPSADQIVRDFAAPAVDVSAGAVSLGEAAGFPSPAEFFQSVKNLGSGEAEVLRFLTDPQFDPAKGLSECVEKFFGDGLVDRLTGRDGLLNPMLGGLALGSSQGGRLSGGEEVGRRGIGEDQLNQVGRRGIGEGELDQVGRRGIGEGELDQVGRRGIGEGELNQVGRRGIGEGELDQVGRRGIGEGELNQVGRRGIGEGELDQVGRRGIGEGELDQVGRRGIGEDQLNQVGRRGAPGELDAAGFREHREAGVAAGGGELLAGLGDSVRAVSQLREFQSPESSAALGRLRDQLGVLDSFERTVRDVSSLHGDIADSRMNGERI